MYLEIWKWIPGYEGYYMASTHGRVKSVDRYVNSKWDNQYFIKGKILKQTTNRDEYKTVVLHKNGKKNLYFIHRLVAMCFIPNPNNYPIINHKDQNPSNNYYKNLEWCSYKYNNNYADRNKKLSQALKGRTFTEEHKRKMRENHADFKGKNHPKAKAVLMFDLNGKFIQRFDCVADANEYLGKPRHSDNIGICLRGKPGHKTAYNHKWIYEEDYIKEQVI